MSGLPTSLTLALDRWRCAARALTIPLLAVCACEEPIAMHVDPEAPRVHLAEPSPTITSMPEWHKNDANPQNRAGEFKWDKLDPKFVAAVAAYSKCTRELVAGTIGHGPVASCLRDMADAIETLPSPGAVNTKAAAQQVRVEAEHVATLADAAPGTPSPQKEAIRAAFNAAATAYVQLSRTSYAVAPVASAARDFEESIIPITPIGGLASHQSEVFSALAHGDEVLKALQVEAGKRAQKP